MGTHLTAQEALKDISKWSHETWVDLGDDKIMVDTLKIDDEVYSQLIKSALSRVINKGLGNCSKATRYARAHARVQALYDGTAKL